MITLKGASPEYVGISTDEKPENVPVNTIFTELDTNKVYYFTGETWDEIGGGGEQ